MSNTHSPTPWQVQPDPELADKHPYHRHRFITSGQKLLTDEDWLEDPACQIICSMRDCVNQKANAEFIIHAVNNIDKIKDHRDFLREQYEGTCKAYQDLVFEKDNLLIAVKEAYAMAESLRKATGGAVEGGICHILRSAITQAERGAK